MARTVIAGNWKMNMTPSETKAFIETLKPMVAGKDKCDIVLCTPYVDLATAVEAAKGSNIRIGAENVHFEAKGAFTGEVSCAMLKEIGVEYVIIGHSERRQYFGETDETVNLRTKAALAAGFKVLLCLGEVKEQRLAGITDEVVAMQTKLDLAGISEASSRFLRYRVRTLYSTLLLKSSLSNSFAFAGFSLAATDFFTCVLLSITFRNRTLLKNIPSRILL